MKQIFLTAVLMTVTGTAFADRDHDFDRHRGEWTHTHSSPRSAPASAPEVDPASAMSGLALLAGGLVVLRGRRSKKSND